MLLSEILPIHCITTNTYSAVDLRRTPDPHPQIKIQNQHFGVEEMQTAGDLKSGDSFFHSPPPTPASPLLRKTDPALNGNDLGHYVTSLIHDQYTIKIRKHRFDARNNLC